MVPRRNIARTIKKAMTQPGYAISAFYKRFRSFLTYHLYDGYSAPPETISLFLTYRCNLRCPMCGQWGEKGSFKLLERDIVGEELGLRDIESFLEDIKGFRPNITLFGGEPMLYPYWIEVVEYTKASGMRCNIVTNGVLLKRYLDDIVRVGLDEVVFSLDGPEGVHDRMRGVKGSFKRAIEGFMGLKAVKEKRGRKRPIVTINCTIYEFNYDMLSQVVDVAEAIGADAITFHHLLFLSKEICDEHNRFFEPKFGRRCMDWYGFVREELPKIDVARLLEEMGKVKRRRTDINISFYPNFNEEEIRRYYTGWEFESDSYPNRCISPWMVAYIFPDGSVRPYHSMEFIPGNIKEARFTEIWNNKRYMEYRRTVKELKRFPVCSKGCTELYRY